MGRIGYLPLLIEETKTISISKLKKWEYLNEGSQKRGKITWSRNGVETSSIGIFCSFDDYYKLIELDYTCNGTDIKQTIQLTSLPSNLGKGKVWYFVCPKTGLLCRKLYFKGGYFYHRKAHKELFYQKQVYSHKDRFLIWHFDAAHDEKQWHLINSKNFKKYYKGKPTKRYQKALNKIKIADRYSARDIDRLFLGIF